MKLSIKQTTMRYILFFILIIGFVFVGCNQNRQTVAIEEKQIDITKDEENEEIKTDEEEIQSLIRSALKWFDLYLINFTPAIANKKDSTYDEFAMLEESNDSIYVGFNMKEHKSNLEKLKKTNFFATEFIENYNQIIQTLDKKMRNKEFRDWEFGTVFSPFEFAHNHSPWCLCQEKPYVIDLWDVDIEIIRLNDERGELKYKWGKSVLDTEPYWKDFRYKFRVTKENNKWKISYMEGFDFEKGIKAWE